MASSVEDAPNEAAGTDSVHMPEAVLALNSVQEAVVLPTVSDTAAPVDEHCRRPAASATVYLTDTMASF